MAHSKESVRAAFAAIAPRYDLLNTVLSLGVEIGWRRRTVARLAPQAGERVLDLCAGTLTLSRDLLKQSKGRASITSLDFCLEMLDVGLDRLHPSEADRIHAVCGDAEKIPLPDQTFDGLAITYGIRNLVDIEKGLGEMHRVLKPGGRMVILDFLKPRAPGFASIYRFYLTRVLPRIGGIISGSRAAYQHLADSIQAFMEPDHLSTLMKQAGFERIELDVMTFGIAGLFHAVKR
ncbi:MAG: bifunctional demethylmenaquinone methyltransferase/2-methoxy-6-polyprenyl-1,4-benzoquinol methylase UbiE [Planctomycetota bacterium]